MNILTPLQKQLLKAVSQSPLRHYVWTGGTALAHRLKHRLSEDLDFFSEQLDSPELFLFHIQELKKQCGLEQKFYEEKMNRRMFIFSKEGQNIKMEFVYFPFPSLQVPSSDPDLGMRIDGVKDIAVNKVLSAFQRKEPKDAYDLYVLCTQKKFDLKILIQDVEKKFGVNIDIISLIAKLVALSEQIKTIEPLFIQKNPNLSKNMQDFFQGKANHYLKKKIG